MAMNYFGTFIYRYSEAASIRKSSQSSGDKVKTLIS